MEDVTAQRASGWSRARAWALVFAYAGAIWFSSSGRSFVQTAPHGLSLDKVLHAVAFGGLAWLLFRALSPGRGRPSAWVAVAAVLAATGWGVLDEVHQSFVPSRAPELGDGVADFVGALFAVSVAMRLRKRTADDMLGAM